MWQQFISEPRCHARGGTRPTVLNLPHSVRRDQSPADRLTELEKWSRNLQDPGWRDAFALRVLDGLVRTRAEETMRLNEKIEAHRQARAQLRTSIQTKLQRIRALEASIHTREWQTGELKSGLAEERRRIQLLEHKVVNAIQSSRSWRLLTRLGLVKSRILGSNK